MAPEAWMEGGTMDLLHHFYEYHLIHGKMPPNKMASLGHSIEDWVWNEHAEMEAAQTAKPPR
jgi:hypothetical protein